MRGNVKKIVDDYAHAIVKEMLSARMIGIKDFRTSCQPETVKARTAVMKRLYAEGFSVYAISRILKMNEKTVGSRFNPKIRLRRDAGRMRRYYAEKARKEEARA